MDKYIDAFVKEEYAYDDLPFISTAELEELIPRKGPRYRLQRWQASHQADASDIKSQKSDFQKTTLFPSQFNSNLLLQSTEHDETKSAISLLTEQKPYILELMGKSIGNSRDNYDAFLSHSQKDSSDLCRSIYLALGIKKAAVWYDKSADRVDGRGMVDGIFNSNEFILVMVKDYFNRPYCIFEWLVAMAFRKPITVLLENDARFGGISIEGISHEVPKIYSDSMVKHEIITINREYFDTFIDKVEKRISRHRKKLYEVTKVQ